MSDQLPIPNEILEYAIHKAKAGYAHDFLPGELEDVRNRAIKAVQEYKKLKKDLAEAKDRTSRINEWLKSIGYVSAKVV